MGEIVKEAKKFTHPDEGMRYSDLPFSLPNEERFLTFIEAIEAEFQELRDRIERVEEEFMDHLANEHNVKIIRPEDDLRRPEEKAPLSHDRHGKPEGGLEPRDVMKFQSKKDGNTTIFLFKEHNKIGDWFRGYVLQSRSLEIGVLWDWNPKHCTFEFRPKFPGTKGC